MEFAIATRMMLVKQMNKRSGTVGSSSAIFTASLLHAHMQAHSCMRSHVVLSLQLA
jgi:hypothetical protein